jgi:hypothetical protein
VRRRPLQRDRRQPLVVTIWFASESMTQIPDFISPHPRGFRHDQ